MAVTVNRIPFNTIPQQWAFDPVIGPFIRELLTIVWQNRERVGGDDDAVANLEAINTYETTALNGKISGLQDDVDYNAIADALARISGQVAALTQENEQLKARLAIKSANEAALIDRVADIERIVATHNALAGQIAAINQRINYVELN